MSALMKTTLAILNTSRGIVKCIRMVRRHHLLHPAETPSSQISGIIHGSGSNDSMTAMPYGSSRDNSIASLGDSQHTGSVFHLATVSRVFCLLVADEGQDGYSSETCLLDDESWEMWFILGDCCFILHKLVNHACISSRSEQPCICQDSRSGIRFHIL